MRNFPLNIDSDSLQSLVKNLLKDYHIKRSNHKIIEGRALVFVELDSHETAEKCIIAYTEKPLTINGETKPLVVNYFQSKKIPQSSIVLTDEIYVMIYKRISTHRMLID
jgi:hypothetical protein